MNRLEPITEKGTRRILIVTHSYAPILNPRAFRWAAVAEHWAGQGYCVDVVSAWMPGMAREEKLRRVQIYRVGGGVMQKLRSALRTSGRTVVSEISGSPTIGVSLTGRLKKAARKAIRLVHDLTWKKFYWPDYACGWYLSAAKMARHLITAKEYDTLITVSDPFTSHLVGLKLKSEFGDTKWLVDIGDPFCFRYDTPTNNHHLYRRLNYFAEGKVFDRADAVTVTTDSTRDKYAELFPFAADKIDVIGPLMAEPAEGALPQSPLNPNGRKKLVFVGTLYRAIRNPKFLLRVFEAMIMNTGMSKVELHLFGGLGDCEDILKDSRSRLGDKLVVHGLVPREDVLAAMKNADVLINIGNDNPYQLPSKVVEYAWMGKPVVNLSRIADDSSRQFFADYPAFLNIHDDSVTAAECHAERLAEFMGDNSRYVNDEYTMRLKRKCSITQIAWEYSRHLSDHTFTPRAATKPVWHIYYGTRGTAGAYIDALLKASHAAGLSARAFVSSRYLYSTGGCVRCFFPVTDRTEHRDRLLIILRAMELVAGYWLTALACLIFRPIVNIHLIDDLRVTYYFARLLKKAGLTVYVTCHDVVPQYHGVTNNRRRILDLADRLVVHSRNARTTLINRIGEQSSQRVVSHPFPSSGYASIIDHNRMKHTRAGLERILKDRQDIILFLGVVRNSKGIATLVEAWAQSKARNTSSLVVAGKWTDPSPQLRRALVSDPTCLVIDRYISDEEFVVLLEAARFAVLPYLDYSHSAILMSCGHCGTPVIVSDINLFAEVLPNYDLTFAAGDSKDLTSVLDRAATMKPHQVDVYRKVLTEAVKQENEDLVAGVWEVYRSRHESENRIKDNVVGQQGEAVRRP
ncbi:MAG: glycosyltransferase [Candidatus Zixiibacteriota bacterium]